jgi:hypothetical protein
MIRQILLSLRDAARRHRRTDFYYRA